MTSIKSAWEFVRLVRARSPQERMAASKVTAPEAIWVEIITNYPDMRWSVVLNKHVPVGVLRLLAGDADAQVRSMVARKRNLPPELLDILARDPDSGVRMAVVHHPSVNRAILELLSNDEWGEIAQKARRRLRE